MNINRTAAVAVLLSQAVNSQKAMSDIGDLINIYKGEQAKQSFNNKC
jgi:hypothetical protein